MNFFSAENIALKAFGYEASWLELAGTFFSLWSVWLMTRNRVLTWPIGNIAVVLCFLLFWQIRLYADMAEQAYYFVTGFWGWWLWVRSGVPDGGPIQLNTRRENALALAVMTVLSVAGGWANSNLHVWWPRLFPEAASFAYLDAATTIASFIAQFLMVRRRLECWHIWIAVDAIGVWLYLQKGVVFLSGLYFIFLILAIRGLLSWRRQLI